MYSVIVAFCNVFAFFNVGLACTLYFVLWLSIKVFVFKKKKKLARGRLKAIDRLVAFFFVPLSFDALLSSAFCFLFPCQVTHVSFYVFLKCKVTMVLPFPNLTKASSVPDVSVT